MLHLLNQRAPGRDRRDCSPPRTRRSIGWPCTRFVDRSSTPRHVRRDCPLHVVPLPWPCSNADYERLMADAVARLRGPGLHACGLRRPLPRGRPPVPRVAAGGHRADADLPAVEARSHGGPGSHDDRGRPGSATDVCGSAGARRDHSPAAASTSSCWRTCRRRWIRAASAASSTRSRMLGRCSPSRSRSASAIASSATASSSATSRTLAPIPDPGSLIPIPDPDLIPDP